MDVLVVDSAEVGELLSALLGRHGLSSSWARSGEEALNRALDEHPAVIVVDADLSDTSGLDLADLLRSEMRCRVVITHAADVTQKDPTTQARIATFDSAFVRPFRSMALVNAVAHLAGKPLGDVGDTVVAVDNTPLGEFSDAVEVSLEDEDVVETTDVARGTTSSEGDAVVLIGTPVEPPSLSPSLSPSSQAARPLAEVLAEEQRQREVGAFAPGELADLWARVKARRSKTSPPTSTPTEGVLSPRALADLLDAFHQSQMSGELWLENHEGARRVLLLRRGQLAGARSALPGEDLLTLLLRRKLLTPRDAARAVALVRSEEHPTVTDALLTMGLVETAKMEQMIELHVRRVAVGAFGWQGRYRFTLENRAAREAVPVRVNIGDVIVHAMVLLESTPALEQAAPDDARFAPSAESSYRIEHLRLAPLEERIVRAMDGTKTIGDLLTLFAPTPPRLVRGLAAGLFCLHMTRFVGRGAASARKISFF